MREDSYGLAAWLLTIGFVVFGLILMVFIARVERLGDRVEGQQYISQVSSVTYTPCTTVECVKLYCGPVAIACAYPNSRPMPCQEDEVYVWVDAVVSARCVNWDDVPSLIERMKR